MSAVWWGNCLGCGRGPRTIYQYLAVEQTLFSCELGRYTAFGIAAQKRVPDSWRQIAFVPDICTNTQQAQRLALTAERAKMSLEIQLNQYQRVLSEQAESLAEERALRLEAQAQLTTPLPEVLPRPDMLLPRKGWGHRLKGWLLGSKTG